MLKMNTALTTYCSLLEGKILMTAQKNIVSIIHFEKKLLPFRSPMLNGIYTNTTSLSGLHLHTVWWLPPRISFRKGRIQISMCENQVIPR